MWCELALNGIGGATIAEAQDTLSWDEFLMWAAYRNKRGSLNTGFRTEVAVARLCALWANYNLRTKPSDPKFTLEDFAPHMDEREVTLEEIAAQMGAL